MSVIGGSALRGNGHYKRLLRAPFHAAGMEIGFIIANGTAMVCTSDVLLLSGNHEFCPTPSQA